MFEIVVRRVCNDAAEAYGKREEALRYRGVPDGWFQKLRPFRGNEEEDPAHRAVQSNRANQQREQHDVWENGQEVGKSPRAFYTLKEYYANRCPTDKKAERQLPRWPSDTVVDALFFVQDHSSVNHFILHFIEKEHFLSLCLKDVTCRFTIKEDSRKI